MLLNSALTQLIHGMRPVVNFLAVTGDVERSGGGGWWRESKRGVMGPFTAGRKSITLF